MPDLSQHACFVCRKVFKKPHWYGFAYDPKTRPTYLCPDCGKEMTYMGYKFRAPRKSDKKEWKQIEEGVKSGENWTTRTIRKEEKVEKPKLSPHLRKALGITKKTTT